MTSHFKQTPLKIHFLVSFGVHVTYSNNVSDHFLKSKRPGPEANPLSCCKCSLCVTWNGFTGTRALIDSQHRLPMHLSTHLVARPANHLQRSLVTVWFQTVDLRWVSQRTTLSFHHGTQVDSWNTTANRCSLMGAAVKRVLPCSILCIRTTHHQHDESNPFCMTQGTSMGTPE